MTNQKQLKTYLTDPIPDNWQIEILKFWSINKQEYPNLSEIAITYLCITCGSCDAERSFSKMRDLNTIKRNSMKSETLRMQMLLYFNGDIEQRLDSY